MKTTYYALSFSNLPTSNKIAIVADLHNQNFGKVIEALKREQPDMILIPGDLMDDRELRDCNSRGYVFLRSCTELAPTYYSLGNHEI